MEELDLIDIFRKLKPLIKGFSYIWIQFSESQIEIRLFSHSKTPHSARPQRGQGLWKFNNSLLKDKNYLTLITESYPIISEKYANIVDKRLRWELMKMEIRSITISFAARKAKEFRKQESDLQKRLDEIDKNISNSCDNQNIEDK